jgi:hypothetical protein
MVNRMVWWLLEQAHRYLTSLSEGCLVALSEDQREGIGVVERRDSSPGERGRGGAAAGGRGDTYETTSGAKIKQKRRGRMAAGMIGER